MRKTSEKYSLMAEDKRKWVRNQLEFLKPMLAYAGLLYLAPILGKLQEVGHVTTLQDFIPSALVVTSITFYFVNALYDLLRKFTK